MTTTTDIEAVTMRLCARFEGLREGPCDWNFHDPAARATLLRPCPHCADRGWVPLTGPALLAAALEVIRRKGWHLAIWNESITIRVPSWSWSFAWTIYNDDILEALLRALDATKEAV